MGENLPIGESMETVIDEAAEIKSRVAMLRARINGQLSDRNRVIDHLLDIRLDTGDPAMVFVVDELLSSVPGLTVVDNSWWSDALDRIERATEPSTV